MKWFVLVALVLCSPSAWAADASCPSQLGALQYQYLNQKEYYEHAMTERGRLTYELAQAQKYAKSLDAENARLQQELEALKKKQTDKKD